MRKRFSRALSLFFLFATFCLIGYLVDKERGELTRSWPYLLHANGFSIATLLALQLMYFLLQGASGRVLFLTMQQRVPLLLLTVLYTLQTMYNAVLPLSGASGTAAFIFWGKRLGYGLKESTATNLWSLTLSYVSLVPLLLICLFAALTANGQVANLIKAGLLVAVAVSLGILLLFYLISRFGQKSKRASHTLTILREEWKRMQHHPISFLFACVYLFLVYVVRMIMVYTAFQAIHVPIPFWLAVLAYSITSLLVLVSLAPTTVGVVEAVLASVLHSYGIPLSIAIAGTLMYRFVSFYLPIPLGALALVYLQRFSKKPV
ncbi:lysylphosphatidylglycerol synthase transmembrane domain-containing protein [Ferroacidibacillus organovorans]|uniref:Phosphatidylglycerol lysyltransferase n=1 Tax=Ferroacidibacillus organovorans TaxID=1765683 RepID=A0A101XPB5_9BACL|nr:lysylphosphatidylglycerol synthase transmembrane domain-containing protein [Ferroacidibacillus organovorans]KUO94974.1 hypothetical protein ATW55_04895 [Ferroacidibacillus organovorans]